MSSLAKKLTDSPEITLAQAKEYDYILLIDKSGSMSEKSNQMENGTRWDEVREFTESFARFAESVDDDGITVITFNTSATVADNVTAAKVSEIFKNERPGGGTALAPALKEAFKKKFASSKNAIILVMTDGEANDPSETKRLIIEAANKIERDEQLAIQFVQVGSDPKAAAFLQMLDDDLQKAGAKFDIVNTLSEKEAGSLKVEQLLYQALND
jgi:Mg-chelatase subunit ChlD